MIDNKHYIDDGKPFTKYTNDPTAITVLGVPGDGYVLMFDGYNAVWTAGSSGGSLSYSHFFAKMPGDNSSTIAANAPVLFPQNGPTSGAATRLTDGTFNVPVAGTYQINFQASIDEAAQLQVAIGGVGNDNTTSSRAALTCQVVGSVLLTLTANSVLSIINPAGNATALTLTPADGNLTHPVCATLSIIKVG